MKFLCAFCRRLKDKYENDLQNLEQTERLSREKYNETRTQLAECEANKQNLQSTVKQLELQLSHVQKVIFFLNKNKFIPFCCTKGNSNEIGIHMFLINRRIKRITLLYKTQLVLQHSYR